MAVQKEGNLEALWGRRFLGGSPIGGASFLGRRSGSLRGGFFGVGGSRIGRRFIV